MQTLNSIETCVFVLKTEAKEQTEAQGLKTDVFVSTYGNI